MKAIFNKNDLLCNIIIGYLNTGKYYSTGTLDGTMIESIPLVSALIANAPTHVNCCEK